jgi:nitroreductase/NAD-dependent dihydropyrimidine dehydrogenase PreA subunit
MSEYPLINAGRCTLCGKCIEVCPKKILAIKDGSVSVTGGDCMLCSHCYCACEPGAVSFGGNLNELTFKTIRYSGDSHGQSAASPDKIINFLRSRRSIRKYTDRPVDDDVIRDIIEFSVSAPSGSNAQSWEFTVVNGRDRVSLLADSFKKVFGMLNRLAVNPVTRYLSVPFFGNRIISYYKNNYATVKTALEDAERGVDRLFHGAPCVIIIHSGTGSMPAEDAQFAAYNIAILAHTLGLGTCFIGYASAAINRFKRLKKRLDIPAGNRVNAVIAAGYPDVIFHRPALRKRYNTAFLKKL